MSLSSPQATATQCLTPQAELEKAFKPAAALPKCQANNATPTLQSGLSPMRGVFVTCRSDILETCRSLVESLIDHNGGATINVLVQKDDSALPALAAVIDTFRARARTRRANLNILSTELRPHVFMRDPGLFLSQGYGEVQFRGVPLRSYQPFAPDAGAPSQSGGYAVAGDWAVAEALKECGIPSSIRLTPAQLDTVITEAQKTPGLKTASDFQITTGELEPRLRDTLFVKNYTETHGFSNREMGGNYLATPVGPYLGETTAPPAGLALEGQPWKAIQIPHELAVGHIDEVFQLVPSREGAACSQTLLRASPLLARELLALLPDSTEVGYHHEFSDNAPRPDVLALEQELTTNAHGPLIKAFNSSGNVDLQTLTAEGRQAILDFTRKFGLAQQVRFATIKEVLGNNELIRLWGQQQRVIDRATELLKADLAKKDPGCVTVVDLPVFWTKSGRPALANPVNGLVINGVYLVSQQATKGFSLEPAKTPEGIEYLVAHHRRTRQVLLESYVEKILKAHIAPRVVFVNTSNLDEGSGNIHCATSEVRVDCR